MILTRSRMMSAIRRSFSAKDLAQTLANQKAPTKQSIVERRDLRTEGKKKDIDPCSQIGRFLEYGLPTHVITSRLRKGGVARPGGVFFRNSAALGHLHWLYFKLTPEEMEMYNPNFSFDGQTFPVGPRYPCAEMPFERDDGLVEALTCNLFGVSASRTKDVFARCATGMIPVTPLRSALAIHALCDFILGPDYTDPAQFWSPPPHADESAEADPGESKGTKDDCAAPPRIAVWAPSLIPTYDVYALVATHSHLWSAGGDEPQAVALPHHLHAMAAAASRVKKASREQQGLPPSDSASAESLDDSTLPPPPRALEVPRGGISRLSWLLEISPPTVDASGTASADVPPADPVPADMGTVSEKEYRARILAPMTVTDTSDFTVEGLYFATKNRFASLSMVEYLAWHMVAAPVHQVRSSASVRYAADGDLVARMRNPFCLFAADFRVNVADRVRATGVTPPPRMVVALEAASAWCSLSANDRWKWGRECERRRADQRA
eukprot:TRINITY_DN5560_c0_g1_i2.p1 TRINITY_DN5560_c0_g1~~TRINITY_DN5560_c0_g1_i2.p1  ORF type:complete len:494 (+),score=58.37 TRINITY_DN5560_c0_g1_i2:67-1548(+)